MRLSIHIIKVFFVIFITTLIITKLLFTLVNFINENPFILIKNDIEVLNSILKIYYAKTGYYPNHLETLVEEKYIETLPKNKYINNYFYERKNNFYLIFCNLSKCGKIIYDSKKEQIITPQNFISRLEDQNTKIEYNRWIKSSIFITILLCIFIVPFYFKKEKNKIK